MARDLPDRPDTDEIAGPEVGADGIGAQAEAWFDEMAPFHGDPRHWGHAPQSIQAATAALADSHVRAVLDQRLDAGIAAPLEIEPGGSAQRDRIAAEDLAEQFGALEIDRISRELLHAVWYGYAVAECLWEIEGTTVRLADLRVRDPARFRFGRKGTALLIHRDKPRGVELPPAKFVLLRQPLTHGGQPHGPGVARWCLWPVWLKRQGIIFWARALEKFGMPALMIMLRKDASSEERDKALRVMADIIGGGNVALPQGQEIKTLESERRAGGDYAAFITAMDAMIADAVLGQRATTEIGPWRGTAEIQADVLQRLVAADGRRLSAALRHSVATWLTSWNHPGAAIPKLFRNTEPAENLKARAERDAIIAGIGGLKPTQAYIEQTYGGQWEAVREEGSTTTQPPRSAFASQEGSRDAITQAAELAAEDWHPLTGPMIEPVGKAIQDAIKEGIPLEDFRSQLFDLFPAMDADPLTERLYHQSVSAMLSGQSGGSDE